MMLSGQKDFTGPQKDVVREWLEKPVESSHPVYRAADHLTSRELSFTVSNVQYYSETEAKRRTEKLRKKRKGKKRERKNYGYEGLAHYDLTDIEEFEESGHHKIEMKVYAGQAAQRFHIN